MIRAFIAIEVDAAVQNLLAQLQRRLLNQFKACGLQEAVRPVSVRQMHLTLCFLGDIEESWVPPLAASLNQLGVDWRGEETALLLMIEQLGGFPSLKRPRVLWCGVGDDSGKLRELQDAVTQAVIPWCGEMEDKPFHPHLTLFRIKTHDQTQIRRIGEIVREGATKIDAAWPVREMKFIRSELTPGGPIYTTLTTVSLGT